MDMSYSNRQINTTSNELWFTDSQSPHQTLLVKKWQFVLSAENYQHVRAANMRVHKTSHALCPRELCYGLKEPSLSKLLEITHQYPTV